MIVDKSIVTMPNTIIHSLINFCDGDPANFATSTVDINFDYDNRLSDSLVQPKV